MCRSSGEADVLRVASVISALLRPVAQQCISCCRAICALRGALDKRRCTLLESKRGEGSALQGADANRPEN